MLRNKYTKQCKFMNGNEIIDIYITMFDKNRNSRQVKIYLFIHYLNKTAKNLKFIQAQIKHNHHRLIIPLYKQFSCIINNVLAALFRDYSFHPIDYNFNLPHISLVYQTKLSFKLQLMQLH